MSQWDFCGCSKNIHRSYFSISLKPLYISSWKFSLKIDNCDNLFKKSQNKKYKKLAK